MIGQANKQCTELACLLDENWNTHTHTHTHTYLRDIE